MQHLKHEKIQRILEEHEKMNYEVEKKRRALTERERTKLNEDNFYSPGNHFKLRWLNYSLLREKPKANPIERWHKMLLPHTLFVI